MERTRCDIRELRHRRFLIHRRQPEVTMSVLYIVPRNNTNGKHPLLTSVTSVSNTSTHDHWLQCRNSAFRLTSVNQTRLCLNSLLLKQNSFLLLQNCVRYCAQHEFGSETRRTSATQVLWPLPKRAGSWVRLITAMALGIVWGERIQSIDQASKQKCRGSTIAVYLAAQTATIVVVRQFCLLDSKCLCVADSDPGSHLFW